MPARCRCRRRTPRPTGSAARRFALAELSAARPRPEIRGDSDGEQDADDDDDDEELDQGEALLGVPVEAGGIRLNIAGLLPQSAVVGGWGGCGRKIGGPGDHTPDWVICG